MKYLDDGVFALLAEVADRADQSIDWPTESMAALRTAGVLRWSIPTEFGGMGLKPVELLDGHREIAQACLTTAFILSQRESAVRQLTRGPKALQERLLPAMARGELFATVGLSQITTSRQHGGPALRAKKTANGFRMDGDIPWVTGADQAGVVVVGATLEDGKQVLAALPTDRRGVSIDPPLPLASLSGSHTASMRCAAIEIEHELILAGPTEKALGPVGGGGLETSDLALGLAQAATEFLKNEAAIREDVLPVAERFQKAIDSSLVRLHAAATALIPETTLAVRVECTNLALKATQAALLIAKGAGFVVPHLPQRLARQALFFLVWSCPRPVAAGVLEALTPIV